MGNEFKSISSQDGSCSVDVGEYAGLYEIRFRVGGVERGSIDDKGLFEIDNIYCRGTIQTANFKTDTISVVGGSVLVRPGDALSADMTALDSSTLTIIGSETFAVNDILRIKDGLNEEWFTVTAIIDAPTYIVTRDMADMYTADNNPAWTKGVAVVNYGIDGDGGILLTSSLPDSPYISVFTHTGNPWTIIDEKVRIGNLNGYLGYGADIHGVGIGSVESGEANLTFDPTNGIRLRQGTTNLMTFDMSGNAQISGFTIGEDTGFHAGSDTTRVQMKPGDGFWCGATAFGDAPFRVNAAGELWAENAHMSGPIVAGELHIPDENTTSNSFHTNTNGDSWWGCTETSFNTNNDNAIAYVLKSGYAKFQDVMLVDSIEVDHTNSDFFIINFDNTDIDTELRFGRTTGGTASITWNGDLVQCSKPFKSNELGINNISDTEPVSPFAGQVWIDP